MTFLEEPAPERPESDERYTLRETLVWCAGRTGLSLHSYDLDVAACAEANCAPAWYSIELSGLENPWWGHVWCNPPYSDIRPWAECAWRHWNAFTVKTISMLLPATRTEQPWWQELVERRRDRDGSPLRTYFLPGRTRFGFPGNREAVGVGSPPFTCVLLVWSAP